MFIYNIPFRPSEWASAERIDVSVVQFKMTDSDKDGKVSLSEFEELENIEKTLNAMFSSEGSCGFVFVVLVVCKSMCVGVC